MGKVGTDAQTQEGDRKGPVSRRHEARKAAGLGSPGVPQQPALGAHSRPSSLLPIPRCLHSPKGSISIQKHRDKPSKFCQAT